MRTIRTTGRATGLLLCGLLGLSACSPAPATAPSPTAIQAPDPTITADPTVAATSTPTPTPTAAPSPSSACTITTDVVPETGVFFNLSGLGFAPDVDIEDHVR